MTYVTTASPDLWVRTSHKGTSDLSHLYIFTLGTEKVKLVQCQKPFAEFAVSTDRTADYKQDLDFYSFSNDRKS